jgi:hypothetical protein
VSEIRTHPNGSTTIGPRDPHRDLVEALGTYASLRSQNATSKEELRALAWFLGDKGEADAVKAIMKHAAVAEPIYYGTPMWGYFPIGGTP